MADHAGAGNAKIYFQVALVVPGQRSNPIAGANTKPLKGRGQSTGIDRDPCPIGTPHVTVGLYGNNFRATVIARGVINQRTDRQRPIHHLAVERHGVPFQRL